MPIPLKWSSGLKISGSDWNNARLYAPADYIVFKEGSTYYAYGQYSGSTDYSGSYFNLVMTNTLNAVSNVSGSVMFFPGKYIVTGSITVPGNISLISVARGGAVLFLQSGSNCNILELNGDNITIDGLTLDGNRTNQTNSPIYGIVCNVYHKNIQIKNNTVKNTNGGGIVTKAYQSTIMNNYTTNNKDEGIEVLGTGSTGVMITNNISIGDGDSGTRAGIWVGFAGGITGSDIIVTNNFVTGSQGDGILVKSFQQGTGSNVLISNNIVVGSSKSGICLDSHLVAATLQNCRVTNNISNYNSEYGIRISGSSCSGSFIHANTLIGNSLGTIQDGGTGTVTSDNV